MYMIQPTRPGQEPNAQIQRSHGGGIVIVATRRVQPGEMLHAEFGDYYWLHCWHRLSVGEQDTLRTQKQHIRYPPQWPPPLVEFTSTARGIHEWTYALASKNIYEDLQGDDDSTDEGQHIERPSGSEGGDLVANNGADQRKAPLTTSNLRQHTSRHPLLITKWLTQHQRPVGWNICKVPSSQDELLVAIKQVLTKVSESEGETFPKMSTIQTRQSLNDDILAINPGDILNAVYGTTLQKLIEEEMDRGGDIHSAHREVAAKLTQMTGDSAVIYIDTDIATAVVTQGLVNRAGPRTQRQCHIHPIEMIAGTAISPTWLWNNYGEGMTMTRSMKNEATNQVMVIVAPLKLRYGWEGGQQRRRRNSFDHSG
jgi:hypothetical protein